MAIFRYKPLNHYDFENTMTMKADEFYVKRLRSADSIIIIYQLLMLILILLNYTRIAHHTAFITLHLGAVLFLLLMPRWPANKGTTLMRFWSPLLVVPLNFSELHFLVHTLRPNDMDTLLIKIDQALLGVHPTIWLEKITFPLLTEYLQIVYSTFYFLPLILAFLLYRNRRYEEFDFFAFIMVFGFYLSYLGYFLVPAIGPRYTLSHLQHIQLKGIFFAPLIRHTLDTLENIQRDAFPSGHTAMTVLTMYYAAKYHKKYFYILLVIGTSLIFSTVYLRYHYMVDVMGGLVLAALVIAGAPLVYQRTGIRFSGAKQSKG